MGVEYGVDLEGVGGEQEMAEVAQHVSALLGHRPQPLLHSRPTPLTHVHSPRLAPTVKHVVHHLRCNNTTHHNILEQSTLEYRVSASLIFRQSAYFKIAISLKTFLRTSVLYKIYDYMKTYTKSTIWYTHYTLYEDAMIIRVIRRIVFQSLYVDFALTG